MSSARPKRDTGNYVSEWFGHRVFPMVAADPGALLDQQTQRCPFLSAAKGNAEACIKREASKGVCTVSSVSNVVRQDWLVCPYRGLGPELLRSAIGRLFSVPDSAAPFIIPAVRLQDPALRADIGLSLAKG